jgi:hypothetical protein
MINEFKVIYWWLQTSFQVIDRFWINLSRAMSIGTGHFGELESVKKRIKGRRSSTRLPSTPLKWINPVKKVH